MRGKNISQIKKTKPAKNITVYGWVHVIRDLGNIKFILLRDISGTIQTVILKKNQAVFKKSAKLTPESVVRLTGQLKKQKQAPDGVEILVQSIKILSLALPELPIPVIEKTKAQTAQSKRIDWRWLDLRKPQKQLVFKVWTEMERAMRQYFLENNFIQIYSPKLMSSPSEGGSELFELPYFKTKAFLAQSPQFYKQMAMAAGLERVFEAGPVFRAEPSFTSRHATEFTSYDFEMSFIQSHQDVIAVEEQMLKSMLKAVQEKYGQLIKKQYNRELVVPSIPFPQFTMKQAKAILKKLKVPGPKPGDLTPEEEKALSRYVLEKYNHEFVFITQYPASVRPFYHMRLKNNPRLTKSFDLLFCGLEITTGAQREHRFQMLKTQAKKSGVSLKFIKDYLNYFKYGCPPHGGAGIGPARIVMKILGEKNIQETTFVHRGVKRLRP
ncbi:MAG: aspartate--tRNA(Asn) ligase [Patescibacteria group bacterium]|nr:aspartate--tRNA(Asn) ligase [Patescibacteria group bacterium]